MKHYTVTDANVEITKLVPGGQALATLPDGKKAFFWGALPSETVTSYQVTKSKSNYLEAVALTIANPSKHRIPPRDPCYLSTSPWQIMDYDYELQQKVALVSECFSQNKLKINPGITTDDRELHYRNKMEYSLYWNNESGTISLAFHQRGTHRKVPITQSSLEHPAIFAKAQEIVADLNARHEEARKYQSLMLRCDQQGNVSGGLFVNGQPHPDFPPLTDTLLGHQYTYSPNGFFQINLPVYQLALQEIAQRITTDKVLDLYAGVGTIGLSVARDRELTLVEVNKAAFTELEKNCNGQHHPILANSEDALDFITGSETVILDPPRAGCHHRLLERLLTQTPPTIIYLSCNPITQARDVRLLSQKYQITKAQAFNFFPRTPHIENLIILKQK